MSLLSTFFLATVFSCTYPAHPAACTFTSGKGDALLASLFFLFYCHRWLCTRIAANPYIHYQARRRSSANQLSCLQSWFYQCFYSLVPKEGQWSSQACCLHVLQVFPWKPVWWGEVQCWEGSQQICLHPDSERCKWQDSATYYCARWDAQ